MDVFASAVRAGIDIRTGNDGLPAVVAVPHGDAVAPPELAGNAPVMDIFKPLDIRISKTFGHELRLSFFDGFHGRTCERLHLDEPLLCGHRFHRGMAAGAVTDGVFRFFDLHEEAHLFQVGDDLLSRFFPSHAVVLACVSLSVPSRFMIMMDSR